ncbi:MAG: CoA-transferase [Betaproteobacteria bacterium RIFCSPLOWO2_02_FULL_63_19]|nr:MAG: CoA-transferase [Betaproteobacteria bacterium RIFCSPLOWO2_02_FULL_63_19]
MHGPPLFSCDMEPMLQGCVVLDCSRRLGWIAGRLLADLGADVTKLEAPGSDVSSADWRALNINKKLIRADLSEPVGTRMLDDIASSADILIATPSAGTSDVRLFDYDRLRTINPRLIVVAITPFGLTGPKAQWRASDIEIMAAGGAMALAGEPEGTPLRVSAPQSYAWAGSQGAVGALTALAARWRTGRGQLVDVSAQAAVITALSHAPTFVDILGITPTRAGAYMTGRSVTGAKYRVFWPCRDGFINFILYGGAAGRRTNEQLVAWMREKGLELGPLGAMDWARFSPTRATQAEVDAMEIPIGRFIGSLTKREFLEGAHKREMLGYPVSNTADISTDPQLEARGFWQDLPGPDGRAERHCGCFVIVDGERPPLVRPSEQAEGVTRHVSEA